MVPASPPPASPADLLPRLLASDPAGPRLTCYDDESGERIELSAKVLANWVAKAANLLQDELDAAPGVTVRLDLPAHWRTAYWALATWAVGATVVIDTTGQDDDGSEVVVTTDPALAERVVADGRYAVLVTLAALARGHAATPAGVVDEAKELTSHPDGYAAAVPPSPADVALLVADPQGVGTSSYADLVRGVLPWTEGWPARPRVNAVADDVESFLTQCLAAWALDGSIVLSRNAGRTRLAERLASERVTVDLAG